MSEDNPTPEEIAEATLIVADALQLSLRTLYAIFRYEGRWPGVEFALNPAEYDRLASYVDEWMIQLGLDG